MKVINLFGGPGSGKSTVAAGLFYRLKMKGVECEYVEEEAKQLVWEERQNTLQCQPYVFAKQMRNLWRIRDKVDIAVTDSPIFLSCIYANSADWPLSFFSYVYDQFEEFDNINYLLVRQKHYNPVGRNQTLEEAQELDQEIITALDHKGVTYKEVISDAEAVAVILKDLKVVV